MARHIESYIAGMNRSLGGEDEADAILAVCAMVGALAIARVIPDQKRSDAVLKAVRDRLIAMAPEAPGLSPST
jgi:TetR/AcrR family transcriptional repressor of nem operon